MMIENMIDEATVKRNDQRSFAENHFKIKAMKGAFTPTFWISKKSGPPGKVWHKCYKIVAYRDKINIGQDF